MMRSMKYYIPGLSLIFVAIMIVAVPEILVAFVAFTIFAAGIGALYIGHDIRKSERAFGGTDAGFFDDEFFGRGFTRRPLFRGIFRKHW